MPGWVSIFFFLNDLIVTELRISSCVRMCMFVYVFRKHAHTNFLNVRPLFIVYLPSQMKATTK